MILIHRISINHCCVRVDNREELEAFRQAVKKKFHSDDVLFVIDTDLDLDFDDNDQKGGATC
jgi:hypothetical protein